MQEWKVLRNGKLWSNRFDTEEFAQCHIEEQIEQGIGDISEYEVEQMTEEEIKVYE